MKHFKSSLIAFAALATLTAPAFADGATEAYVQKNASEALASLNDPELSQTARTKKFEAYMDEFTDLDAVSNFVIGKYSRRFSDAELERYHKAFRVYSLAVYEAQLDDYRGNDVEVISSVDRSDKDSIVNTVIKRGDGQDMDVRWRVLTRNGEYQVVDVALNLDGNLIWLAIEQRAQFLSILDNTNGSVDALIEKIESMTAELNATKRK